MRKRWQPPRPLQELLLVKMGSGASYRVSSVRTKGNKLSAGPRLSHASALCVLVCVRVWITHGVKGDGEETWILTIPLKTLTGWTHVNFQPQAGSVHKVGGCGSWKRRQVCWVGLYAPFSTLLPVPIKLLITMC